jgi:hypothetical protein
MDLRETSGNSLGRHPWEVMRARLLAELVTRWTPRAGHLETMRLRAPEGVAFTRDRAAGRFDWLLLLDVLEHVEDDRGLSSGLVREQLAPGRPGVGERSDVPSAL